VVAKIHEIYRQSEEISHYSTNNNSAEFKAALGKQAQEKIARLKAEKK